YQTPFGGGPSSVRTRPRPGQPYTPQTTPAAYSPAPALKPERGAFAQPAPAPRSSLAKVRAVAESERGGETYKVVAGDTPRLIAEKTGVSEKALIERNDLAPTRLKVGQVLNLPKGGKAPVAPRAVASKESKPASPPSAAPDVHVVNTTQVQPPASQAGTKPQSA